MTVGTAGTGLYAKAKQRMLNKIGKKTSLTRNERVDYVSPRLDEIARTRKEVASLVKAFRTHYRKTLWAGTQLGVHLVAAWSAEIGSRSFVPEIDAYLREKDAEELLVVQEASDDIRTVMESLEKISTTFDGYLRQAAANPLGLDDDEDVEMRENVLQSKETYKVARTRYSDAVINYKLGVSSSQELDAVRIEYENRTKELESKMAIYEEHWRKHLFGGISHFFKVQLGYVEKVSETLSDLEIWTSHMSLDVEQMKSYAEKEREKRQIATHLRAKAGDRVRKPTATPILGHTLPGEVERRQGETTPFQSVSSRNEASDDSEDHQDQPKTVPLQGLVGRQLVASNQNVSEILSSGTSSGPA